MMCSRLLSGSICQSVIKGFEVLSVIPKVTIRVFDTQNWKGGRSYEDQTEPVDQGGEVVSTPSRTWGSCLP